MLYTLLILAIVRLGAHIYLPGISATTIKAYTDLYSTGTLYNIIAGGAGSGYSIFALGIGPYITASIIMPVSYTHLLASHKLPIKCKIVSRAEQEMEGDKQ